jgi:hypothetical protein
MILFAAGSQAPAWEPSREAPASRVHVISHAFESSWEMTRSWSFVVSVPKLELGNQRTCVIVTLIHAEPDDQGCFLIQRGFSAFGYFSEF